MFKVIYCGLLFTIFCLFSCLNIQSSKKRNNNLHYKTCNILIECPNNTSYYVINFNNLGEGGVGFCFEKRDTLNYLIERGDSITKLISFHLPDDDIEQLDSLLVNVSLVQNKAKKTSHDSFKYTLKLDDVVKIDESISGYDLYAILKIIVDNFPKAVKEHDYCGFFDAFSRIKNP